MHKRPRHRDRTPRAQTQVVQAAPPRDQDLRAIFSVVNELVGRAGRTNLALALRGSRSKRVLQLGLDKTDGHGHFAGRSQEEVIAVIDQLLALDLLRVAHHDGYPLLEYGPSGLQLAMRFAAEDWLGVLRAQVPLAAKGEVPQMPFLDPALSLHGGAHQRNHDTVELLAELVAREATPEWLPLLRHWHAAETRRIRARLWPLIGRLCELQEKGPGGT